MNASVSSHKLYSTGYGLFLLFVTPLAILDLIMMCIGFMFLGVYPLSIPATQRVQQPYLAWLIVSIEMIVVYGVGWIWCIFYWLPIEYTGEIVYTLFMLIMNLVQPIVQASLAAYISNSYEGGVLTKT